MLLLNKPITELNETELARLTTDEVREGKTLDYKLLLPSDQTEAKKEFLADVCSFANTAGGHILFGVVEDKGVAVNLTGVPDADLDAAVLRLENSIRDGIDPPIPVLQTHSVRLNNGAAVVIMEIGRSWAGPHMVTYKGTSRFFARNSAGKYQLDVQEIRTAFLGMQSAAEKFRAFRTDRIAKAISGDLGFELIGPAATMLHVCSVSAFALGSNLGLEQMRQQGAQQTLRPIYSSGWSDRVTFDGYMRYVETHRDPSRMRGYVQVFRNGCLEAVDCSMLTAQGDPPRLGFPTGVYEHKVSEAVGGYLAYLTRSGLEGPFVVALSVVNVRGYVLFINGYYAEALRPIDRDHLVFPEIVAEDSTREPTQLLKPAFDALWNACGFDRSFNYDEAGVWSPRR